MIESICSTIDEKKLRKSKGHSERTKVGMPFNMYRGDDNKRGDDICVH